MSTKSVPEGVQDGLAEHARRMSEPEQQLLLKRVEQNGGTPCRGGESTGFYVYPTSLEELTTSKEVCAKCPLRRSCLATAKAAEETGVWGGFYLKNGNVQRSSSPFRGKRGVRTQTDDEMFDTVHDPIPIHVVDGRCTEEEWAIYYEYVDDGDGDDGDDLYYEET